MTNRRKRIKEKKNATFFSKGVIVNSDGLCQEEKRKYTLLLKGMLVYLIVMGAIGCFLSSLDVKCSMAVLNIVILLFSIFCASLYYNKIWEKTGYLLLLLLIIVFGNAFSNYINSGFYAIANDISEKAALFFDTSAMRSYGEQVGNRYAAITISMCFIGSVCCVLANILISRRMAYKMAAFISFGAMLTPLYLELEPDMIYVIMLVGGLISVYIINKGGHYSLTQDNSMYEFKLIKQKISYTYAARTAAVTAAAVLIISAVVIGVFSIIFPQTHLKNTHTMSSIKKSTMDTVENISVLGMMGLFNFYPNTGGLTSGALGGVSSVRLDLETDLTVEFAPYSDERIYLKTFTGGTYIPYSNRWSRPTDINNQAVPIGDETAARLRQRYEEGGEYSARGVMKVTNVAAAVGVYLPYYSEDIDKQIYPGRTQEYTYYPRVYDDWRYDAMADGETLEEWLYVPRENIEVIADFVKEAGLSYNDVETVVKELTDYYQENIPYTLKPGMTPYRKDFVNYFLAENKRGYCAHFASAATLIFRYLGIPARYVEGYAVDPTDIAGRGEILSDKKYEEYYDGYSPLQTNAVVSVDATDANAHAWVEVYDSEKGWIVAEVTPMSYEDEEGESLWQRLMNFLTGTDNSESEEETDEEEQDEAVLDEQTRQVYVRILLFVVVLVMVALICRPLIKKAVLLYKYHNSDRNVRLIMRYQNYLGRIMRKNKELTNMVNYEEQVRWLLCEGFWKADRNEAADCVKILEKAGFSAAMISEEEFERVVRHMGKGRVL